MYTLVLWFALFFSREDEENTSSSGGILSRYSDSPLKKMLGVGSSRNVFFTQAGDKHSRLIIEIEDGDSEEEDDEEEKNRHLFSRSVSWTHALLVAALPLDGKVSS